MSTFYYFNTSKDENGNHEVHTQECRFLPNPINREMIGLESSCESAIARAKREYLGKTFDGCYFCSNSCHRG